MEDRDSDSDLSFHGFEREDKRMTWILLLLKVNRSIILNVSVSSVYTSNLSVFFIEIQDLSSDDAEIDGSNSNSN
jgi:hypothetical protein